MERRRVTWGRRKERSHIASFALQLADGAHGPKCAGVEQRRAELQTGRTSISNVRYSAARSSAEQTGKRTMGKREMRGMQEKLEGKQMQHVLKA